ncbi:MAG: paraquat-inducible protein A, partial [Verrucomicrobiales bacterium]
MLIALGCNISVLFVPFLDFRELLKPEVYTFFHTIEMLWGDGLYALAILVIGFSLLFPFFKLAVLFLVVLSRNPGARLRKALNRVEMLAKWSMLDVFLVCLVLTLTSGQVLVGATPKGGVPLFMSAIVISMAVGQVLAHRLLDHSSQAKHFRIVKMDFSFRVRKFLVCVSGLTLLGALVFPFLKIESWFLVDSSFSVVTVIPALWSQSSYAAVVAVAFFLILFPVTRWVVLAFRTWKRPHGARDKRSGRIFELARFWSMLDV